LARYTCDSSSAEISISAFDKEAVQRKQIREPSAAVVSLYCQSG